MNLSYYSLNALLECIYAHNGIPYIIVDRAAHTSGIPATSIKDNMVTLNLAINAVTNFNLDPVEGLTFSARFNRISRRVHIPLAAVAGVYDKSAEQMQVYQLHRSQRELEERHALFQVRAAVELEPSADASLPIGKLSQAPIETAPEPKPVPPADIPAEAGSNVVQGQFGQPRKSK